MGKGKNQNRNFLKGLILVLLVSICVILPSATMTVSAKTAISKTKISLKVGMKQKLTVTGTYMQPKWTSSNQKIARVSSSGYVVALRKGSATITGKIGSKKYKCKVKVTANNSFTPKKNAFSDYKYYGTVIVTPTKIWYGSDGKLHAKLKFTNSSYKKYSKDICDLSIVITANPKKGKSVIIVSDKIYVSDDYLSIRLGGHQSMTREVVLDNKGCATVDFAKVKSIDYDYEYDFYEYDDDDDDDYDYYDDDDDDDYDYDDYDDDDDY